MKLQDYFKLKQGDRVILRGSAPPIRGTIKKLRLVTGPGEAMPSTKAVVAWDHNPAQSWELGHESLKQIFETPPDADCKICSSPNLVYAVQWDWQHYDEAKKINIDEVTTYYLCWKCGQGFALGQMRPKLDLHRLLARTD